MIFMPSFRSSNASFSIELTCLASSNLNHLLNNFDKIISLNDQILIVLCLVFLYKFLYFIFSWSSVHGCTIFFSLDAFCVIRCCSTQLHFFFSNLFTMTILMYSLSVKVVGFSLKNTSYDTLTWFSELKFANIYWQFKLEDDNLYCYGNCYIHVYNLNGWATLQQVRFNSHSILCLQLCDV